MDDDATELRKRQSDSVVAMAIGGESVRWNWLEESP